MMWVWVWDLGMGMGMGMSWPSPHAQPIWVYHTHADGRTGEYNKDTHGLYSHEEPFPRFHLPHQHGLTTELEPRSHLSVCDSSSCPTRFKPPTMCGVRISCFARGSSGLRLWASHTNV